MFMESRIYTKLSLCFALTLFLKISVSAQSYKFEILPQDNGLYKAVSNIKENDFMGEWRIICGTNKSVAIMWFIAPIFNDDIQKKKEESVKAFFLSDSGLYAQIYLSNGEVFTTKSVERTGELLWFANDCTSFTSNRRKLSDDLSRCSYFISQLRKYNIQKISVGDGTPDHLMTLMTPGFRSAATTDAMCKALIAKTGDQGQYGTFATKMSSSNSQGSYSSSATINILTFHQLICCLFGVVPENMTNSNLTFSYLKSYMSKYPQWNIKYTDYYAKVKCESGFDMSYRGCPIDEYSAYFFKKQDLYSYKITFAYRTGNYQADATKQFSSILNDLRQAGATRREIKPEGARRCIFGDYAGREYSIHLWDHENYSTVRLEIKVPRYTPLGGNENSNESSTASNHDNNLFESAIVKNYSQKLHMERSVSISSTDLVNKVLGMFMPMSEMWMLKSSLFHKSFIKAGGWDVIHEWKENGGFLKPPFSIIYLGRPIKSMRLYFSQKRDYCLDFQSFGISMEHKADMKKYAEEIIADMRREGFPLRELNASNSNIKHAWGCVSGDKFILVWANKFSRNSYDVFIEINRVGSDLHKSYKLVNNFL